MTTYAPMASAPRCGVCERTLAPFARARILDSGRLAHPTCTTQVPCTVCGIPLLPNEADASGRCTECAP